MNNSGLVLILLMAAIWYVMPAYGQTYLWLDGSCNYSWAVTLGLLYLYPWIKQVNGGEYKWTKTFRIIYVILGSFVGGYLETISFAVIAGIFLIGIIKSVFYKERIDKLTWSLSLLMLVVGYCSMIFAPATRKNKLHIVGLYGYVKNFFAAIQTYKELVSWLIVLWIFLAVIALYKKSNFKRIILSVLMMCFSFGICLMHTVTPYIAERSFIGCVIFAIIANGVLVIELFGTEVEKYLISGGIILILLAGEQFLVGGYDIYNSYSLAKNREAYIMEQKSQGNLEVEVDRIYPETKYSAMYKLRDLAIGEAHAWPNGSMEKYYGMKAIIGR